MSSETLDCADPMDLSNHFKVLLALQKELILGTAVQVDTTSYFTENISELTN